MLQRQDVIEAIAKKTDMPMAQVSRMLDAQWEVIGNALRNGEGVQITGYATFTTVQRKPRVGRNPHTGEAIQIPSRKVVQVKPGSKLKAMVDK